MATYNTISTQHIIRKVMRDIKTDDANWTYDAVEWIGEALEHIGAGAHVETRGCVIDVKDFKAALPPDVYYINQVSINEVMGVNGAALDSQLQQAALELRGVSGAIAWQDENFRNFINIDPATGESRVYIDADAAKFLKQLTSQATREIQKAVVRFEAYARNYYSRDQQTVLAYCTTNFPDALHCDNCVNKMAQTKECYYVEKDRIKTSFKEGKICLSYTAFATDTDCYPLIPNDISYKEATFWYVYKKLLLSGVHDTNNNGIDYNFADQKWKYYCTQARNDAKFPDIARYESFMNQWVRLVPRINVFDDGFETLGDRENLYRGNYTTSS